MKKMCKFIKSNFKVVIAFLVGGIVFGSITTVAAYTILSSNVSYSNTTSGSSATNVQDAIDDLYIRANGQNECKIGYTKQNESSSGYECRH